MSIEKFEEIPAYLEANKDKDEVKTFVNGLNPITIDKVKSLVNENKDFKSWIDSEKDKHLTKGIETFKTNNLTKLIDEEVKKRYPDKDPKDTEIANLKTQFENMQKEAAKKELTNKALKTAQEKKLPTDLVDYFVGADEETTMKNIEKLTDIFAKHDEALKTEFAKNNSYTPPGNHIDLDAKKKLEDEVSKYFK